MSEISGEKRKRIGNWKNKENKIGKKNLREGMKD